MVNLTRELGTRCTVSSYLNGDFKCENAINGILAAGAKNEWASKGEKEGAWINITFTKRVIVYKVQIWRRCAADDQCRQLFFEFSDGQNVALSTVCVKNRSWRLCTDPNLFTELNISPGKLTNWVKLTSYNKCDNHAGNFGFREVQYIGRISI
ncbi:hypothetical protein LSH36_443g03028 [Paralvinella palmiformis]|uniref:DUF7402 domain-containing protein n=1 Tax=Paralvinella palmiformis TaxID=53620 RepID=A0AAD9JBD3_9ANNE|nr:hypothetical protein LSH36_443g03028 [Paralvinella palmiformis]